MFGVKFLEAMRETSRRERGMTNRQAGGRISMFVGVEGELGESGCRHGARDYDAAGEEGAQQGGGGVPKLRR